MELSLSSFSLGTIFLFNVVVLLISVPCAVPISYLLNQNGLIVSWLKLILGNLPFSISIFLSYNFHIYGFQLFWLSLFLIWSWIDFGEAATWRMFVVFHLEAGVASFSSRAKVIWAILDVGFEWIAFRLVTTWEGFPCCVEVIDFRTFTVLHTLELFCSMLQSEI